MSVADQILYLPCPRYPIPGERIGHAEGHRQACEAAAKLARSVEAKILELEMRLALSEAAQKSSDTH